jgi:DNA repair exonuclease SbcCD ATPase subunit
MEISLTNFKNVLETFTYSFEKGSLIHLVGPSGAGKSTILCAIEWCLFGKLNGVKPRSKRDLAPRVVIQTDKIKIDRNGNELTVLTSKKIELTSDAAQGYILTEFGDRDLWKSCSYLEQRSRNLLLEGSGEDKLKILRELVYGYGIGQENDPEYYLIKVQEQIKKITTQKKASQAVYDSYYKEVEKSLEKYEESQNRWESCEMDLLGLKKKLETLTKEFKDHSKFHNEQLHYRKSLEDLKRRKSKINIIDLSEDLYKEERKALLEQLDLISQAQENIVLYDKIAKLNPYKIDPEKYQSLKTKKASRDQIVKDLSTLGFKEPIDKKSIVKAFEDQVLIKELKSLKEIKDYIEETKEYNSKLESNIVIAKERLRVLKDKVVFEESRDILISIQGNLEKSIQSFKARKPLKCPSCREAIYITGNGDLTIYEKIDIDDIKGKLSEVKDKIELLDNISKQTVKVKELEKSKSTDPLPSFDLERYNFLISLDLNVSLKSIQIDPKNKEKVLLLLDKLDSPVDPQTLSCLENGESLSRLLGPRLERYINNPESFKPKSRTGSESEIKSQLKALDLKFSEWRKACSEREFIESEIKKVQKNISSDFDEGDLDQKESELEDLRLIEIDQIRYAEMQAKMAKLDESEAELNSSNKQLEVLDVIYEQIRKISIEPVEKVIESINYKLNEYLERMFTDIPIRVMLSLFRNSTGSKRDSFLKIAVNLQVYHGENSYPNVSSLSGGEADRVSLALTLTLAEIYGSQFLLLDECMASLDSDLRECCLSLVKASSLKQMTVIDVCHESCEGYHDSIVSVI